MPSTCVSRPLHFPHINSSNLFHRTGPHSLHKGYIPHADDYCPTHNTQQSVILQPYHKNGQQRFIFNLFHFLFNPIYSLGSSCHPPFIQRNIIYICMCVMYVHVSAHICVCGGACVCICMQRPQVDTGFLPQSLSILFLRQCFSLNPELTNSDQSC